MALRDEFIIGVIEFQSRESRSNPLGDRARGFPFLRGVNRHKAVGGGV